MYGTDFWQIIVVYSVSSNACTRRCGPSNVSIATVLLLVSYGIGYSFTHIHRPSSKGRLPTFLPEHLSRWSPTLFKYPVFQTQSGAAGLVHTHSPHYTFCYPTSQHLHSSHTYRAYADRLRFWQRPLQLTVHIPYYNHRILQCFRLLFITSCIHPVHTPRPLHIYLPITLTVVIFSLLIAYIGIVATFTFVWTGSGVKSTFVWELLADPTQNLRGNYCVSL